MSTEALRDTMKTSKAAADAVLKSIGDDEMTDEQSTAIDTHIADYEKAEADLHKHEANQKRLAAIKAMDAPLPPRTLSDPADVPRGTRITDPTPDFDDDPKRGFKTHRDFLSSVIGWTVKGEREDSRLQRLWASTVSDTTLQAAAGSDEQSTFSDPYGGFLVPAAFSPTMLSTAFEGDPLAGRTQDIPMASPVVNINARVDKNHTSSVSGGLRVYRRAEADTSSSSRMELEQIELRATGLFGVSFVTEELLMDSPGSFVAMLDAGFRDEFASVLLNERLNGTGVGEFLGVNNSPCLVSITKETGQVASTLVYNNIIKMRARCWGYGNAIWLANHDTIPQLAAMNQSVGTGGQLVWAPSAITDVPDMLLGRPLILSEYMETLGTAGDIILGNWTQYLEGTYQPLGSAESVHVRFVNHERTFKFFMRNAGTPWWRSALTVRNGSNSLTPFVRVAARA